MTAAIAFIFFLCSATFDRLHAKATQQLPPTGDHGHRKVAEIDNRDVYEIFCGLQRAKLLLEQPRLKILLDEGRKILLHSKLSNRLTYLKNK